VPSKTGPKSFILVKNLHKSVDKLTLMTNF